MNRLFSSSSSSSNSQQQQQQPRRSLSTYSLPPERPIQHTLKRVKVSWSNTKLVIPCGDTSDRVSRLLEDITARFRKHSNLLLDSGEGRNWFVELRTEDGYLLDRSDTIDEVIADGEQLQVVDYRGFIQDFKSGNELEEWLSVEREDFVDDMTKWVKVGHSKSKNKLFIEMGAGKNTRKLLLFDQEQIDDLNPAKPLVLIDEIEGTSSNGYPWYCYAHFSVDVNTGAKAVELAAKSMSDPRPQIEVVELKDGQFFKGNIRITQEAFGRPATNKSLPLPPALGIGPSLDEEALAAAAVGEEIVDEVVSVGPSAVYLCPVGKLVAEQIWDLVGAWQLLRADLTMTNGSESEEVRVVDFSSEFRDMEGNWILVETARPDSSPIQPLKAGETQALALIARIPLDPNSHQPIDLKTNRTHSTLPVPLGIRFTLIDSEGNSTALILTHRNPLPVLPTRTQLEHNLGTLYHYVQCDDTSSFERVAIAVTYSTTRRSLYFHSIPAGAVYEVTVSRLRRWLWDAMKAEVEDLEVTEWRWEAGASSHGIEFWAVVDAEGGFVQGVKLRLWTSTSEIVDFVRIPVTMF